MQHISSASDRPKLTPCYSMEVFTLDPRHIDAHTAVVQRVVNKSGDPTGSHAHARTHACICERVPALGGSCPATYMQTKEGRQQIETLVQRMQSGAYN